MKPVFEKLKQLGIGPIGQTVAAGAQFDPLLERIKRRAAELLRQQN
jgi:hypothetical protein